MVEASGFLLSVADALEIFRDASLAVPLGNFLDGIFDWDFGNLLEGILDDFFGNILDGIFAMSCFLLAAISLRRGGSVDLDFALLESVASELRAKH